jgi:SAM-dependent methyltransferase
MTGTTDQIRGSVREHYAKVAEQSSSCCSPGCCGQNPDNSLGLGYSEEDLAAVPDGANLGLGCGNPQAIASLGEGETVLDLGSGAGFDAFLAARQVGPRGRVIGVDMTPEMLAKARDNARHLGANHVELRLGEIEHVPVGDSSVDVILSNCVINLSPEKSQVFREAFRVLKPGGRLAISDVVATRPIPDELGRQIDALCGCVSGAAPVRDLEAMLTDAGFSDVRVEVKRESREFIQNWLPGSGAEDYVASATIQAIKAPE